MFAAVHTTVGPAGPKGERGPMGPARTSCVSQVPTYSTSTTLKRMSSTTPSGRTISRSVLVAVVDCSRSDGVLIGGTCNTFLKNGTEDDLGVEPLSMVAIVPFDHKQPNTTGFVECRARIPEDVELADLDWDIEAVAECCLDSTPPNDGGSDWQPASPPGDGTSDWRPSSPPRVPSPSTAGGATPPSPSLTIINNPPGPTAFAMPSSEGLEPGEEEIEFDPGANGFGGAWSIPSGSGGQQPQQAQQPLGGMPGWQSQPVPSAANSENWQARTQNVAAGSAAAGSTVAGSPSGQGPDGGTAEGQPASVVTTPQAENPSWLQQQASAGPAPKTGSPGTNANGGAGGE